MPSIPRTRFSKEKRSLSSSQTTLAQGGATPRVYRLLRGLVRVWFALFFRAIRLLHAEAEPGPDILAVSHPASFLDALILVASFERQVHCLLDRRLVRGLFRGLLARGLGMIRLGSAGDGAQRVLEKCSNALAKREAVVVFAEPKKAGAGEPAQLALAAASIALDAETRHSRELGVNIFPIHLFLPVARPQSSELLIHVDAPLVVREFLSASGGGLSERARALAAEVEKAFRQNVFGLRQRDFELFLSDLEEVLREDLEGHWATQPNWKQKSEGFDLSRFAAECVHQLNFLNPGRLVALRESLEVYREARRRGSLRRFEVEAAGAWLQSPWRRTWVWVESALGLPIATYGLINHLLAWIFLFWAGLLEKENGQDKRVKWIARTLVVLGCYAGQVLLCAALLGRREAGLYAPSLPFSGVVLWSYGWLVRRRTRLALAALRVPREARKLRRMRKDLLEQLNHVVHACAEMSGVAH